MVALASNHLSREPQFIMLVGVQVVHMMLRLEGLAQVV
jgi:hypothetical protein